MFDNSTKQALLLLSQATKLIEKAERMLKDRKPANSKGSSDGVAASWDDPEVREKRTRRWACEVEGNLYPSVKQACDALAYRPRSGHIKWRGRLVEEAAKGGNGLTDESGRIWRVIERTGNPNWESDIAAEARA